MNLDKVSGIIPPIVIPFARDGDIDETAFHNIVKFNLKNGFTVFASAAVPASAIR
jgi:4-hydroxy-tetrahydrodipicolinate synthase